MCPCNRDMRTIEGSAVALATVDAFGRRLSCVCLCYMLRGILYTWTSASPTVGALKAMELMAFRRAWHCFYVDDFLLYVRGGVLCALQHDTAVGVVKQIDRQEEISIVRLPCQNFQFLPTQLFFFGVLRIAIGPCAIGFSVDLQEISFCLS